MIIRILIGLLVMLHACSCAQLVSHDVLKIQHSGRQGIPSRDLNIPGLNSGYGYNTFILTNDTTVSIHLRIVLSDEFQLPAPFAKGKFKLFLLPRELTPDTITFPDRVSDELRMFLARQVDTLDIPSILDKTLEPGSKCVITIGMLPSVSGDCGVRMSLVQNYSDTISFCESRRNKYMKAEPTTLGLKVDLNYVGNQTPVSCMIIPCGIISYIEK